MKSITKERFEERILAMTTEIKTSAFCGTTCTLCKGSTKDCFAIHVLRVRQLEQELAGVKQSLAVARGDVPSARSMLKDNKQAYIKFKKYDVSEILPFIGKSERYELEPGVFVKIHSVRLQTFKKSLRCVSCGIEGTHFWAEKQVGQISNHLNLYGINAKGEDVLMTKDHIIPKSKGGSESLKNMQTMCTECNRKKGNNLE